VAIQKILSEAKASAQKAFYKNPSPLRSRIFTKIRHPRVGEDPYFVKPCITLTTAYPNRHCEAFVKKPWQYMQYLLPRHNLLPRHTIFWIATDFCEILAMTHMPPVIAERAVIASRQSRLSFLTPACFAGFQSSFAPRRDRQGWRCRLSWRTHPRRFCVKCGA
jgi:hypothetical protein